MCRKLTFLILFVSTLAIVNRADAGVIMQCDVGGCGVLQSGWIEIGTCGTTGDVGGTGIDVTLATGEPAACDCRKPTEPGPPPGPLVDVERDLLFANDEVSSPGGDFIITFSNLIPGAEYWLFSYHNRPDEDLSHIEGVQVTGATNVTKPDRIAQDHAIMEYPATILFTAGGGDVSIRYLAPTEAEAGRGAQAFLNGFVLGSGLPTSMSFESGSSGGFESASPAELVVTLQFPEPGQTYTVDYAVTGGTATGGGVDYTLSPGTLTFNPGEASKTISIDIVDDGTDEVGETIVVGLSNPTSTGAAVELGEPNEHTYTILDSRPTVGFETDNGTCKEDIIPPDIRVSLAFASDKTITVDYAVTDGSATGGGVDYTLEPGTLTFEPGQTSKSISLELVDDGVAEGPETVVVTLSNPTNATLSAISQFTYTILDSTQVIPVGWWKFDEGSGSTARDSSGNDFHGSIHGLTEWVEGYVGTGALSIGRGYVVVNDDPKLRPSRVTACAWINLTGPQSDYARVLEKGNDNNESYLLLMWEGKLIWGLRDSGLGQHNIRSTVNIPQYEWVFVAGVYDGTNIIIYIDGELDNSQVEGSFTPTDSSGEVLGMGALPPDFDRRFLMAKVDDVRVYDRALSADEIRDLYIWKGGNTNKAALPDPEHLAEDVYPYVTMSWLAGKTATSHDVYLGTDYDAVNNATTGSSEFMANVDVNSYDAGLLGLAQTYYWRVDEVDALQQTYKGEIWQFAVDDGKAYRPRPSDGQVLVAVDADLSWTAGAVATSHDVYFGTDETAVAEATPASGEYMGNFDSNSLELDTLEVASTYYWRVDERGDGTYAKGDVWEFGTVIPGTLHLKVDLALPACGSIDNTTPVPGTAKPGWWHWVAPRWWDMYMHDAVWERGEGGEGPPPQTDGIGGTGVHAAIGCGGVGNGGFHVYHMCRCNLAGDCCPTGIPVGDPIANGWYHNVDWGGEATGDILMRINGLPPGKYVLISYHNHWEPATQETRNCLDRYSTMPNMPVVKATSLPVSGLPEYGGKWNFTPGTGMGVTPILNAYDVDVTSVTSDDEVSMSLIKFHTDGNDVLVIYDGGDNTYPDPARPGREGSKGILNAFELILVEPDACKCPADLAGTDGFSAPDGKVDTGDMAKLLSELILGGGTADDNYKVQSPSLYLLSCGDLAGTDGFSAPDGRIDTGDMAKLLSHLITSGDPDNNYECDCVALP